MTTVNDKTISPPVSVIIVTYNRADLLVRTLTALSQQSIPSKQFEVIVVDDGSRDHTAEVCDTMRSELPNLKYFISEENLGIPLSRNRGIEMSSGSYILFTDDDCIPEYNWVERLSAVLEREQIAAGAVSTTTSNYTKLCHNISQFHAFMPEQKTGPTAFVAGANMAFRRAVLDEIGMFRREQWCAEDTEIGLRARSLGYRIFFEPGAVVIHDPDRTTFADIFRYAVEHARATIHLRNKYRSLLGTPSVLRSPGRLLIGSPFIALLVTAGIYAGNLRLMKFIWTAPVVYGLKLAWCWGAARGLRTQIQVGMKP